MRRCPIKRERSSRESVRPALARSYRNRFGLHHLLGPLPAPPRGLSRAAVQGSMAQRPSSIHKAIHTGCRHPTVHTFTRTSYSHSPFRERTGHDIYLRGARGSPLRTLTPSSRSSPPPTIRTRRYTCGRCYPSVWNPHIHDDHRPERRRAATSRARKRVVACRRRHFPAHAVICTGVEADPG